MDLSRFYRWCEMNGLTLNTKKCFSITFARLKQPFYYDYAVNGVDLQRVSKIKDLGVTFDDKLTFISHIERVTNVGFKKLGFINRITKDLSVNSYRVLFMSLVRTTLEYGSAVWSPFYRCHIDRLERVQKRFVDSAIYRMGMHQSVSDGYNDRLNIINLLSLENRRVQIDMTFLFKLLNGPTDCPELLSGISFNTVHRTRNTELLHVDFHSSNYGSNGSIIRMCRFFNEFGIDPFMSRGGFKRAVSSCRRAAF